MEEIPGKAYMPAVIAIVLLGYFGLVLFLPMVIPNVAKPSEALTATLVNLTIAAIAYFIGTTQQSAKKDNTIASLTKG